MIPSKTVRGSTSSQRRSSAQSRRMAMPSHHTSSGLSATEPVSVPARRRSGTQPKSWGSTGVSKSALRWRMLFRPRWRVIARVNALRNKPRSPDSYLNLVGSMVCRSNCVIPYGSNAACTSASAPKANTPARVRAVSTLTPALSTASRTALYPPI